MNSAIRTVIAPVDSLDPSGARGIFFFPFIFSVASGP